MSFLFLMGLFSALSWLVSRALRRKMDLRNAMRFGAASAFVFTGVDHFISGEIRYLPMMPPLFGDLRLPLIWFIGAAEIAGAIGLIVPSALSIRLHMPGLRCTAGIALSVLLAYVVIANIHVAISGGSVNGLDFGAWYFWMRPFLQPFIILWVLYASNVIWRDELSGAHRQVPPRPPC